MGFDISSATIGWAILEAKSMKKIRLIDCGYLKPLQDGTIEERIHSVMDDIRFICEEYNPDEICVEEITKFMKSKSSADSIIVLASFNRTICYILYTLSGKSPDKMMPATIRAIIRKHMKMKGRLDKEEIYDVVKKRFKKFKPEISTKGRNKGSEKKENRDTTDAIAAGWAWIIENLK